MSSLVSDAATVEIIGRTPWPDTVKLYQPYEVGQILMPEFASCLSVKAFLNMCGLKFQTELRTNAEFMSPSGKVPFVQIGPLLVSEFDPIVSVANAKGHSLSSHLTDEQRADMKAYISMVQTTLVNSLHYLLWLDKETLELVTKPRYGSPYKWPLNKFIPLMKKREITRLLSSSGWAKKSSEEVYEEVKKCCQMLSDRLGDQMYFFGSKETELDAFVFGHLFTVLTTNLPSSRLAEIVQKHGNLADLCRRIHEEHFKDLQKDS